MQKISDGALAVVLAAFILSASVSFTLAWKPLYYFDIGFLHIAESSGYEEAEIRANYDALIAYNLSPGGQELEFPTLPMSETGRIHFAEVKAIFQLFLKMMVVSALVLIPGIWWKSRRGEHGYLLAAGVCMPVFLAAAGGLIAADWDRAFVLFHEMVFQNDYWIFDEATDPVITILPDMFFLHCALLILAGIALGCVVCLVCWRRFARRTAGKTT